MLSKYELKIFSSLTVKCFDSQCMLYFHPICMKKGKCFVDVTAAEDYLIGVCYCEKHSLNSVKKLIERIEE
jgi:hypothetical protein